MLVIFNDRRCALQCNIKFARTASIYQYSDYPCVNVFHIKILLESKQINHVSRVCIECIEYCRHTTNFPCLLYHDFLTNFWEVIQNSQR